MGSDASVAWKECNERRSEGRRVSHLLTRLAVPAATRRVSY